MTLINKKNFLQDEEPQGNNKFVLPSVVTKRPDVISIQKSIAISTALHPAAVLLIWIFIVIAGYLGLDFLLFQKPPVQLKKDIEFVLVDKEGTPRNPNTKNRSDRDSRSGGINDPKRKVSMPSPSPSKKSQASAPKSPTKVNKPKPVQSKPVQQKASIQNKTVQQATNKAVTKPVAPKPSVSKPAPPTVRPSSRPVATLPPSVNPMSKFTVPAPVGATVGKTLSTGPVGGTSAPVGAKSGGYSSSSKTASGAGAYAPRPSLSPSMSGGNGQLSRGGSGYGNMGNPGGGGGSPGIDALREPDFGPYMRELQRRIKLNWDPPKGNESKRVVLLFKIARDGRLLSSKIHKSSGMPNADQAALKAVELTAPFRPLPADFKGQSVDIQFTFDYNVFNASRY